MGFMTDTDTTKEILIGLIHRYGCINLETALDTEHFFPHQDGEDVMALIERVIEKPCAEFVHQGALLFSPLCTPSLLKRIRLSVYEFGPLPSLGYQQAEGWSDAINLPVTSELEKLVQYCLLHGTRNKDSLSCRTMFFQLCNEIVCSDFSSQGKKMASFVGIPIDTIFTSLFEDAALVQPSWCYAGKRKIDRMSDDYLNEEIDKGEITLDQIDEIEQFCLACGQFYGFIEKHNAYRIYRIFTGDTGVSKPYFLRVLDCLESGVVLHKRLPVIMSKKLFYPEEASTQRKSLKQSLKEIKQYGTRVDPRFRAYYWLLDQRKKTNCGYFVPSKEEFFHYNQGGYLPFNADLEALKSLVLTHPKEETKQFNRTVFSLMQLCHEENEAYVLKVQQALHFHRATTHKGKKELELFFSAQKTLPLWIYKGYSYHEIHQNTLIP